MIFDWNNYLLLAEFLNKNNDTDASKRSSISRAYYSVYHKVRIFCLNELKLIKDFESKGRDCHIIMSNRLIEQDDIDLLLIANQISALRERRKKADYESDFTVTNSLVLDTIEKSKEVIQLMKDFNT